MKKRKRVKGYYQGSNRKWTIKSSTIQATHNAALDNLDRLWKLTEEMSKKPLSSQEEANVKKVRLMLMTLLQDIAGQQQPPLTNQDTQIFSQEIERLLQQPPFVDNFPLP